MTSLTEELFRTRNEFLAYAKDADGADAWWKEAGAPDLARWCINALGALGPGDPPQPNVPFSARVVTEDGRVRCVLFGGKNAMALLQWELSGAGVALTAQLHLAEGRILKIDNSWKVRRGALDEDVVERVLSACLAAVRERLASTL